MVLIFLLLAVTGGTLRAADPPTESAVISATSVARANLRDTIGRVLVAPPDLYIADFLDKTGGADRLNDVLAKAEPVGGPRWLDKGTCQVRLTVPADSVFTILESLATERSDRSPTTLATIRRVGEDWKSRSFTATGASVLSQATTAAVAPATANVPFVAPIVPPPWTIDLLQADGNASPAGSRLRTIRAAERVALIRLRAQAEQLPVSQGVTIGDVLAIHPQLTDEFDAAVRRARAAKIEYLADGSVQLRVTLDGAIIWNALTTVP
jgi:hypothetical protein